MDRVEFVVNPGFHVWRKCIDLYVKEGWNVAEENYNIWTKSFGPENFKFIVAYDSATKELLGTVAVGFYESIDGSPALVPLGDFLVVPHKRGTGLGLALWEQAFSDRRFDGHNYGLVAVQSMSQKYAERNGYDKFFDAPFLAVLMNTDKLNLRALRISLPGITIKKFIEVDYAKVLEYDRHCVGGLRRDKFLCNWMTANNVLASLVAVEEQTQNVVGFVTLSSGPKDRLSLCPLYAQNVDVAECLVSTALTHVPNFSVFGKLKVLAFANNKSALAMCDRLSDGQNDRTALYGQFTRAALDVVYNEVFSASEFGMNVV